MFGLLFVFTQSEATQISWGSWKSLARHLASCLYSRSFRLCSLQLDLRNDSWSLSGYSCSLGGWNCGPCHSPGLLLNHFITLQILQILVFTHLQFYLNSHTCKTLRDFIEHLLENTLNPLFFTKLSHLSAKKLNTSE